jgi:proline dehydrogenase
VTALLRAPTLWLTERWVTRRIMTERKLGRQLAERFVAGDTLEAAMDAANSLAQQGIAAMLDHLGENVTSPAQTAEAADGYILALKQIRESPDIDCNISVKLTQLGLDSSTDLCLENVDRVLQVASNGDRPLLVMIDMEAHEYVDQTLQVYLALRAIHRNVGVCLQSYLHRTAADAIRIAGPEAIVRVAKGAYLESPDVAFRTRREVTGNYARVAATLLAAGSTVHLATHDESLIEGARAYILRRAIRKERYEFQMLYGIRRDLQAQLVAGGEPVRVYIPYGTSWYPYLTRRLAERPANVWFFLSNLLRR